MLGEKNKKEMKREKLENKRFNVTVSRDARNKPYTCWCEVRGQLNENLYEVSESKVTFSLASGETYENPRKDDDKLARERN